MSKEKQNELLINDVESNNSEVISNKQIEEMAKVICKSYAEKRDCETFPTAWCYAEEYATLLYCEGYRKQSEVEWITEGKFFMEHICSVCGYSVDYLYQRTPFCPNCGAMMKGGAE